MASRKKSGKSSDESGQNQMGLFPLEMIAGAPPLWKPPEYFPDLTQAKVISFDVETKDPNLRDMGPGAPRGDGYIVGIGIGTDDGFRGYFPIRHEGGGNLNEKAVTNWLKKQLSTDIPKVGANCKYDLEWLATLGIDVKGSIWDVQVAEPLLNENKFTYSLESLAKEYLDDYKDEESMNHWLSRAFGGTPTRKDQAKNIWRAPAAVVGSYGEKDVDLPLRIFAKQRKLLESQGLWDLFLMESELIPILVGMRRRGVRVDVQLAEKLRDELLKLHKESMKKLQSVAGRPVNPNATADLAKVFDALNICYPSTSKGAPSITKPWLKTVEHPVGKLIQQTKMYEKFRVTFIEGYILNSHHKGRVYGQFHQLKSDESGTISGRLSSSSPNLENIPGGEKDSPMVTIDGATEKLGKWVRMLFLPDEGQTWYSDDYSQVEYRIICHYGKGPSAEAARQLYITDKSTDFHNMTSRLTGLDRKPAKAISFGKAYGAGAATIAHNMGCSLERANEVIRKYDEEMPFISELLSEVSNVAEHRGYIRTILGRRARFDMYEEKRGKQKTDKLYTYEEAVKKFGERNIRRARCYKALNSLIQGSAADIFKLSLVKIKQSGIIDYLGAPLNLVHDEICWSVGNSREHQEAHEEALRIMETAVKLSVPLLVDSEWGPNWGSVQK